MEVTTGIPPLSKRREKKALTHLIKVQASKEHPMNKRIQEATSGRLKRSSFARESKAVQRKHKDSLPTKVEPLDTTSEPPPWERRQERITICTSVPYLGHKDEHSDVSKRSLTLAMMEERYPKAAWIHAFTDGSATDATKRGGAGVNIQLPDGRQLTKAAPTGMHCSNYRAEVEALTLAADTIKQITDELTPVVFLTDARSVLEALQNNKQPRLQEALQDIKSPRTVLQWVPAHCGIAGNDAADRAAKEGASQEQEDNPVTFAEMTTIIRSLHNQPQAEDSYHQLSRQQQVTIFRLRTGHNRLNHHMSRKLRLAPSPLCSCGLAEQTAEHILQDCPGLRKLRDEIWPEPAGLLEKLHGCVGALQKTADFVMRSGLHV